MARRLGVDRIIISAIKASQKAAASERRRHAAYIKQQQRELKRIQVLNDKLSKLEYRRIKENEAHNFTVEAEGTFYFLKTGLLKQKIEDVDISILDYTPQYLPPLLSIPDKLKYSITPPSEADFIGRYEHRSIKHYLFKSENKKRLENLSDGRSLYLAALLKWENDENERLVNIKKVENEHLEKLKVYEAQYKKDCDEINTLENLYYKRDEFSVSLYTDIVLNKLDKLSLFIEFEIKTKVAYNLDSREMIVEYKLPNVDCIPNIKEYKYVNTKDDIVKKERRQSEIDNCYKYLISNIALKTIANIIKTDKAKAIQVLTFNGYIEAIDKAMGHTVKPIVLSVQVITEHFKTINLDLVDSIQCLKSLSAMISPAPNELIPIKPIRDLNMIDKRFIPESDIVSSIDSRSNLMDLNPFDFEILVTNLFSKLGLDTKLTRSSKDGGVDAVAFDSRPILGGKIIIQAKRYKNTVGVSAVRDLYGTMLNEGAAKGILVTTSSYGTEAYTFSKDKPIELIDGQGLLYLLDSVGVKAKIILPK